MDTTLTVLTCEYTTGRVTTEDYILEVDESIQDLTDEELSDILEKELGI